MARQSKKDRSGRRKGYHAHLKKNSQGRTRRYQINGDPAPQLVQINRMIDAVK